MTRYGGSTSQGKPPARARRRRVQKSSQFSEWELSTYTPLITKSWTDAKEKVGETEVGLLFYDALLGANPDLKEMFTGERTSQAAKFAAMLGAIADAVTMGGEDIKGMLRRLAPMHVRKGVSAAHMPKMGACLFSVLGNILKEEWDQRVQGAWGWLWGWLSKSMEDSLEAALYDKNSVIVRSWDMAMDNYPDQMVGEIYFDTLFQYAPNLRDEYRQTRPILAGKFLEMISTLVNFHGDKARAAEQLRWLGIRHVAYNAKRSHVDAFCEVLMKTLERCVGEDWTEEMAKEWEQHWYEVCATLFESCESARDYGPRVEAMWGAVRQRTDAVHFGTILRKRLLSGTEWVATLNQKLKQLDPAKKKQETERPSLSNVQHNSRRRTSTENLNGNGNGNASFAGVHGPGAPSQVSHESDPSDLSSPVSGAGAGPKGGAVNGIALSARRGRAGSTMGIGALLGANNKRAASEIGRAHV